MFDAGRKAPAVQRWLGHHSASFTLNVYIHLLDDEDLGGPLEPLESANKVRTDPTPLDTTSGDAVTAELAELQALRGLGHTA